MQQKQRLSTGLDTAAMARRVNQVTHFRLIPFYYCKQKRRVIHFIIGRQQIYFIRSRSIIQMGAYLSISIAGTERREKIKYLNID
jgi:UV DNA damage repair endonuclease